MAEVSIRTVVFGGREMALSISCLERRWIRERLIRERIFEVRREV